ncbi:hypothetical protein ACE6H2_025117 [Prunus campanulata]
MAHILQRKRIIQKKMEYKHWGPKVDVVVFCFLDLASNYEPPDSLAEWLEAGEQPVYIGFDSLCPTTIVPFFGDQPLWGERVHARGVGHAPIPADEFSLEKRAVEIAKAMDGEDWVIGAVNAFHRHFPHNKSEDKPESLPARRGLFSIKRCFGYSFSYT